jgi:hypothetical protein
MQSPTYQLTLEERRSHLHARVIGERTAQNAKRFFEETYSACVATGYSNVLLEIHLSGASLDHATVMRVIGDSAATGAKLRKIAYVQPKAADPAVPYVAERAAIDSGMNVRVFRDVAAAERWLGENWRFRT